MNSVDNTKRPCIHPYFVSETKKEVRNVFNECREINSPTWNPSEGHSAMDMEVLYISSLEFDKTAEIKIKSNRYSIKLLTILI